MGIFTEQKETAAEVRQASLCATCGQPLHLSPWIVGQFAKRNHAHLSGCVKALKERVRELEASNEQKI